MAVEFPNVTQMKPRVPRPVWDALRAASIVAALALCVSLFFVPRVGLFFFWGLAASRKLMGDYANGRIFNILAGATVIATSTLSLLLLGVTFAGR